MAVPPSEDTLPLTVAPVAVIAEALATRTEGLPSAVVENVPEAVTAVPSTLVALSR